MAEENKGWLTCEDCGKVGPDVVKTICPYMADVENIEVPAILCPHCEEERARDI